MSNKNPMIWGPHTWTFLFSSVLSLSPNNTSSFVTVLMNLGNILPDQASKDNYNQYLKDHPITQETILFDWLLVLYNKWTLQQKTKAQVIDYFNQLYGITTYRKPGIRTVNKLTGGIPTQYNTMNNVIRKKGNGSGCGCGRR